MSKYLTIVIFGRHAPEFGRQQIDPLESIEDQFVEDIEDLRASDMEESTDYLFESEDTHVDFYVDDVLVESIDIDVTDSESYGNAQTVNVGQIFGYVDDEDDEYAHYLYIEDVNDKLKETIEYEIENEFDISKFTFKIGSIVDCDGDVRFLLYDFNYMDGVCYDQTFDSDGTDGHYLWQSND